MHTYSNITNKLTNAEQYKLANLEINSSKDFKLNYVGMGAKVGKGKFWRWGWKV